MAPRNTSHRGRVLEIGARTIYEFKAHPKRKPWDLLSGDEKREAIERMRRLVKGLSASGYAIVRSAGRDDEPSR
jgi:hypothetical protein